MVIFPLAQVAFVYLTNLPFSAESSVFATNSVAHILMGIFMPMIVLVLRMIKSTETVGLIVCNVLCLIPSFSVLWGILVIATYGA